jgi:dsDNA-specific endonuclease/ATPase MutS2
MNRARESLSDRERDLGRFLSELHSRLEEAQKLEADLKRQRADLAAREKELAREWERRESAKLNELERRTEQVLAKFEEQAQETIDQISRGGSSAKPRNRRSAAWPRPSVKCARSSMPRCFRRGKTRGRANCAGRRSRKARA